MEWKLESHVVCDKTAFRNLENAKRRLCHLASAAALDADAAAAVYVAAAAEDGKSTTHCIMNAQLLMVNEL